MLHRLRLALLLLLPASSPLVAQEAVELLPDTIVMREIQAVATRTERESFEVPAPVDVIDASRIEAGVIDCSHRRRIGCFAFVCCTM